MKLTFEKTRGTRTLYFPLEKSEDQSACFVVMIRPFQVDPGKQFDGTDEFEAGIAWCNPSEQFVKRRGRTIAFERLNSKYRLRGAAQHIIELILAKMMEINERRNDNWGAVEPHADYYIPDMDEGKIEEDLGQVMSYDALSEYFTKKEEHKVEQQALEA